MPAYPPLHPSNAGFADIRADNGIYVDKTHHFRHLLDVGGRKDGTASILANKQQFMVRPRRFGKTLLVDTLETWFQGLPPNTRTIPDAGMDTRNTMPVPNGWTSPAWLWDGLAAAAWHGTHGWHPVVKLDMSQMTAGTPADMQQSLQQYLGETVNLWVRRGLVWDAGDARTPAWNSEPARLLMHLLHRLSQTYSVRPVVLVDEYDAPLTRFMGTGHDLSHAITCLRDIYRVLKDDAGVLYGAFVIGITRLARQYLFSAANNFIDISTDTATLSICGFTEAEVQAALAPHRAAIQELEPGFDEKTVLAEWRDQYNGYRFSRSPNAPLMYNPYTLTAGVRDVLSDDAVRRAALSGHWPTAWSETAHPALIMRLAAGTWRMSDAANQGPSEGLDTLEHPDFAKLMQDTGYYTWRGGERGTEPYLAFPNREVAQTWARDILGLLEESARPAAVRLLKRIHDGLRTCDMEGFASALEAFCDHLAYQNLDSKSCFRAVLQSLFRLGTDSVQAEKSTWAGRSDLEVVLDRYIYVMEVKYSQTDKPGRAHSAEAALAQIRDKPYGREHLADPRTVMAVGLSFRKDEAGVRLDCEHRYLKALLQERDDAFDGGGDDASQRIGRTRLSDLY